MDVASALQKLMDMDKTSRGQIYNLAGPKTYTNRELLNLMRPALGDSRFAATSWHVPKPIMRSMAALTNKFLYWPTMTPDDIDRKYIDELTDRDVLRGKGMSVQESWEAVDIIPTEIEGLLALYLSWQRAPAHVGAPKLAGTIYTK